nr:protein EARLY RESPONSIVE TO DEHYDRATION 15-like [Ipomoea batatas]
MATSTLNPNIPIFVSSAYRPVEDFSDQRLRFLRECYADPFADGTVVDSGNTDQEETKTDLVTLGALKWQKTRVTAEIPKYGQKAPKTMNVKDESGLESGKNRKVSMVSEVDVVGTKKANQRFKDPRILRLICSQR